MGEHVPFMGLLLQLMTEPFSSLRVIPTPVILLVLSMAASTFHSSIIRGGFLQWVEKDLDFATVIDALGYSLAFCHFVKKDKLACN